MIFRTGDKILRGLSAECPRLRTNEQCIISIKCQIIDSLKPSK